MSCFLVSLLLRQGLDQVRYSKELNRLLLLDMPVDIIGATEASSCWIPWIFLVGEIVITTGQRGNEGEEQ